ncbi:hypothetical protein PRIPAC_93061, partial [Pristionchus pacificus]|uniref:Ech-3 n=1 Tax=Pristionchus pacificus TaxID=54126 RepID=A0A8R1V497_PRIPA
PLGSGRSKMFRTLVRASRQFQPTTYCTAKAKTFLRKHEGGMVTRTSFHGMDDVAVLTLDNPDKKNAMTGRMLCELHENIKEIAASPSQLRALVLRGAEGNFSAGADLEFVRKTANAVDGYMLSRFMSETLWEMASLPMPVIAVLERNCLGGAAELAIAADIRVASTNARMSFVHSRMGITPGFGSVRFLKDVVGRSTAIELLASGELMDVERLWELRLVSSVYEGEEQLSKYMKKFTRNGSHVIRASKMVVRDSVDRKGWEDRRKGERRVFLQLWGSKDHRDALSAERKNHRG